MILAIGISISVLILLAKTGWLRRALGHQALADVTVTVGLVPLIGTNTLGGLGAVIWGGVFFSLTLFVLGLFMTSERYVRGEGWIRADTPFWFSFLSPFKRKLQTAAEELRRNTGVQKWWK